MDRKLKELELKLRDTPEGCLGRERSQALKQQAVNDFRAIRSDAGGNIAGSATWLSSKRFAVMVALAAAAVLLVIAAVYFSKASGDNSVAPVQDPEIAAQPATDAFIIINTAPARKSVIAQDFDKFLIKRCDVGDRLGRFILKEVKRDELLLVYPDGSENNSLVRELNEQALASLEAETDTLKRRFKADQLTTGDLDRLKSIACIGQQSALRLIQDLAASNSELSDRAGKILHGNHKKQRIQAALNWARRSGSKATRIKAIRSLGKTKSPLALQFLKELAIDIEEESLAMLCVENLKSFETTWKLPALEEITGESRYPSVRQAAAQYRESIIAELHHDN
ncbi:HEAT repeat domain-containing protein [Planctomycetota bacterium]